MIMIMILIIIIITLITDINIQLTKLLKYTTANEDAINSG
jgi:hypothetical protein